MEFEKIIAISGMPGLFAMAGNRHNGLIVEDMDTGKKKFVSMRKHQFSPLETISIYTYTDSIPVKEVLAKMEALREELPPPDAATPDDDVVRVYFREVVPDYDEDSVHTRDMKKVLRWYAFLHDRDLINSEVENRADEEE